MKRTQKARYFAMGLISALLVSALIIPAGASLLAKTIQVFTGVDLYVDDVKLMPKDAQGNPVEVFVYNGTTYLPVRAVAGALGTVVQWEGKTNSVFVGKHSSDHPEIWLEDLDYFFAYVQYGGFVATEGGGKDNTGAGYAHEASGYLYSTYKLNGQYARLKGTLYQTYSSRTDTHKTYFKVYADGALAYSAEMTGGTEPIDFDIPLSGALEIEVQFYSEGYSGKIDSDTAALGNCGFYLA